MIVDSIYGGKLKERQEEINQLQVYFTEHVADSWQKLTSKVTHINTFQNNCIPAATSIQHQLTAEIRGMKQYVKSQMDTLAHISWPYELFEPQDLVMDEEAGLAVDRV